MLNAVRISDTKLIYKSILGFFLRQHEGSGPVLCWARSGPKSPGIDKPPDLWRIQAIINAKHYLIEDLF